MHLPLWNSLLHPHISTTTATCRAVSWWHVLVTWSGLMISPPLSLSKSYTGHGNAINELKVHTTDPCLLLSASKGMSHCEMHISTLCICVCVCVCVFFFFFYLCMCVIWSAMLTHNARSYIETVEPKDISVCGHIWKCGRPP